MTFSLFETAASLVPPAVLATVLMLLKTTCLLLAALAITLGMRRAAAGTRHVVWFVALTSLLLLPGLAAWAPVPIRMLPARVAAPALAPVTPDRSEAVSPVVTPVVTSPSPQSLTHDPVTAPRRPVPIGLLFIALWSLGVVALLARLALGAWSVRRIVRSARVLDHPDWNRPLYEIADRLGLDEAPTLLQSDRIKIPFAHGFLKARVVLPVDSESWSPERRTAVLIHELAHVQRRDLIGHTVSWIVCALYWFHPLVWTAARRLRIESERACDDLALMLGERPSQYAEHLLDIVTQVREHNTPAVALAMATPSEFEGRMLAILNPQVRRQGLSRVRLAGLVGSLAAVMLLVGAVSPARRAVAQSNAVAGPESDRAIDETASEPQSGAAKSDAAGGHMAVIVPPGTESAAEPADPETAPTSEDHAESMGRHEDDSSDDSEGSKRVEVLTKTLRDDPSPEVRRVAAWGLANYADEKLASEELAGALVSDESAAVREMAAWALAGSQGSESAVTALYAAFWRDKSPKVRVTAAWAAGNIGDRSLVQGLVGLLSSPSPELREVAAWSIGNCGAERAPAPLVRLLKDPDNTVRLSATWALREIADPSTADELEAAFRRETDPEVRLGLIRALGSMGDRAVETLSRLVDSDDPEIRTVAVTALAGGNATGPWPWPRPEPRPFP